MIRGGNSLLKAGAAQWMERSKEDQVVRASVGRSMGTAPLPLPNKAGAWGRCFLFSFSFCLCPFTPALFAKGSNEGLVALKTVHTVIKTGI